jgi:hypothetical protein
MRTRLQFRRGRLNAGYENEGMKRKEVKDKKRRKRR